MKADLELDCYGINLYLAPLLHLEITFYEDGILRVLIDEKEVNPKRFRLTKNDFGATVQEKELKPLEKDLLKLVMLLGDRAEIRTKSKDGEDNYLYIIRYSPFRIE